MVQWDARLAWALPLRASAQAGRSAQERLHFCLECYNLLDCKNPRTVDNNYGAVFGQPIATFMQPTSDFPPREVQLGIRLVF